MLHEDLEHTVVWSAPLTLKMEFRNEWWIWRSQTVSHVYAFLEDVHLKFFIGWMCVKDYLITCEQCNFVKILKHF